MNILFIGNSVHLRTRSFDFFIGEVLDGMDIKFCFDDGWPVLLSNEKFDVVLFWQVFPNLHYSRNLRNINVIYIPMWDDCTNVRIDQWLELPAGRFLCFSEKLFNRLKSIGLRTLKARYFPELMQGEHGLPSNKEFERQVTILFWQREPAIDLSLILSWFSSEDKLIIYYRTDIKNQIIPTLPNSSELRMLPWFETRNDYLAFLSSCDCFVAPRQSEGIGLSFLEAMATGAWIFAWDNSTMNEYIKDGINGQLMSKQRGICFNRMLIDQKKRELARGVALDFRTSWLKTIPFLKKWLVKPNNFNLSSKWLLQVFFSPLLLFKFIRRQIHH